MVEYYDGYREINQTDLTNEIEIRWVCHYHCSPTYTIKRYHHRYILIYVVDGECICGFMQNGILKQQVVGKGNLILYRPSEYQYIVSDSENPLEYVGASFSGKTLDELIKRSGIGQCKVKYIGVNHELVSMFNELISYILLKKHTNILYGQFIKIIGEIQTCIGNLDLLLRKHAKQIVLLNQSINYMFMHYNEAITVEDAARVSNYSTSRYQYLFKKYMLVTPTQFLTNLRINKAKLHLCHSNLTVKEIARSVGYNDPFYFSKVFKSKTGLSPTEYRQEHYANRKFDKRIDQGDVSK
jgi:AraC-like DNA-binding protein